MKELIGKKVEIYRNLNNGMWSIKLNGKVVGYSKYLTLSGPIEFKVSEAGRQRVIRQKRKNVHARIVGYIKDFAEHPRFKYKSLISYDPYCCGFFFDDQSRFEVFPEDFTLIYFDADLGKAYAK